jgi:hypothetical protein
MPTVSDNAPNLAKLPCRERRKPLVLPEHLFKQIFNAQKRGATLPLAAIDDSREFACNSARFKELHSWPWDLS